MSTKTMRLPPRRVLTPSSNSNNNKNKRRDDEQQQQQQDGGLDAVKESTAKKPRLEPAQPDFGSAPAPAPTNHLLAGYLAHEFLTKGTLFGQPWDSAGGAKPSGAEAGDGVVERYVAVSDLLSVDGSHLAGVFNPAQLARLLQL